MIRFGIQRPTIQIKKITPRATIGRDPAFTIEFTNGGVVEVNLPFLMRQDSIRRWVAETYGCDLLPTETSVAQWASNIDKLITASDPNRRGLFRRMLASFFTLLHPT